MQAGTRTADNIHVYNSILTHNPLYCTRYVKVVAH